MSIYTFIVVVIFFLPLIALFDYLLFRKYIKCEICGYSENNIYVFLPATVLEYLFFLSGFAIAVCLFKGGF